MPCRRLRSFALAVVLLGWPCTAWSFEIAFERMQLPNGLTLIVHEDHSVPRIAYNLMFRAGSKEDPAGRRGLATLVGRLVNECGTARAPENSASVWLQYSGAKWDGSTNPDFTDYTGVTPPATLPLVLWALTDRLSSFAPTAKGFAEQLIAARTSAFTVPIEVRVA